VCSSDLTTDMSKTNKRIKSKTVYIGPQDELGLPWAEAQALDVVHFLTRTDSGLLMGLDWHPHAPEHEQYLWWHVVGEIS
jgi:hypothetical protein